jgi:hypothetical protein
VSDYAENDYHYSRARYLRGGLGCASATPRRFEIGDAVRIGNVNGLRGVIVARGETSITVEWSCNGEKARGCFEPHQLVHHLD